MIQYKLQFIPLLLQVIIQIHCSTNTLLCSAPDYCSAPESSATMNTPNTPNTSEFSNQFPPLRSKLFKTKEEALAYAHNHARQHRYGLTTRRSGEQGRKITLCCDRGSYQDTKKSKYVSPELRKRGKTTRQTECPYQLN